jgi:hypothetical protein
MEKDMINSIVILTEFGSKEGLPEARLILLAHPFPLVSAWSNQLIKRADHCHIHHVLVVVYKELVKTTNGFRDASLDLHRGDIFRLFNVQCDRDSLSLSHVWGANMISRLADIGEYRAAVYVGRLLDELWGETWEPLHGNQQARM